MEKYRNVMYLPVIKKLKGGQIMPIFIFLFSKIGILSRWAKEAGTSAWLVKTEEKYGGLVTGAYVNKLSPNDTREFEVLRRKGMRGGDRMNPLYHNYAPIYSKYLKQFLDKKVALLEVGILRGTGLAIWSDLFGGGRVIGADIDLFNYEENIKNLRELGAFSNKNIEVHLFDQFENNIKLLENILKGDKLDIVIDDGAHTDESILKTLDSICPHLNKNFVYFIEDNSTVWKKVAKKFPKWKVINYHEMTVCTHH
ncbi:MAG: hypothetical protein NUV78_02390 [Candidatus Zambryskibacteria bacterium]|nr:hypothetical protein [Candidatus Zambryskibacteria bacterium]